MSRPPMGGSDVHPEMLLKYFDLLTASSAGVKKLEDLILVLAFKGKLSAAERQITGGRNGHQCAADPEWPQKTVKELAREIINGFACSKKHQDPNGHVHLRTHNVGIDGRVNFDLLVKIDPEKVHASKSSVREGDVLFNNTNSVELVGKTCLVEENYEFGFSNHLTRIRLEDEVNPAYFVYYFNHLLRRGEFAALCNRWIGQAGINQKALKSIKVPVPPVSEQRHIVAAVDQLMSLCSELKDHLSHSRAKMERFASALVHCVADA